MMPDKPVGKGMVLTPRDRRVIADVASFQVLTREQLMRLGHFGSKSRANARLSRLFRHGYLSRREQPSVTGTGRALYFTGPKGHELATPGASESRRVRRRTAQLSDLFLAHQLLITDIRIAFQQPASDFAFLRWMNEAELRALALGLIPDGHVEYSYQGKHFGAFLEVDRGTEMLLHWTQKVHVYQLLATADRYRSLFGRPYFRVIAVAENETRLNHLRHATAKVTDRMFWFTTLDRLLSEGPLNSIWRRPVDAALHSLTES